MATWNSSAKTNREGAASVNMEARSPNLGEVVSVRGSVVDVRFETRLPPIYTLLRTGKDGGIAIEVLAQIDVHRVRGMALTPTQGLARGIGLPHRFAAVQPRVLWIKPQCHDRFVADG